MFSFILQMTNDRIWILLARKVSGEATPTELEELALLVSLRPGDLKDMEAVTAAWALQTDADTDFLEATYLVHLDRLEAKGFKLNKDAVALEEEDEHLVVTENRQRRPLWKKIFLSALAILALGALWTFFKPFKVLPAVASSPANPAEVLTAKGARSKIQLPDGSNVWLNSGSKITYGKSFEKAVIREVYLTGEAFFDVVKNAKRPFIVHTPKIDVRVLGTRFNVKAYEDDKTTETSLIKGSVEVFLKSDPLKKYLLKPDQKLVLLNDGKLTAPTAGIKNLLPKAAPFIEIKPLTYLEGAETDVESSWTKNILSFEDESFLEVAKKMERWYDVKFEFKNKRWEQQFLNGSFEKESLEQAIKALQYSTGFNFRIEEKTVLIY
jgi:transmembrane sensor